MNSEFRPFANDSQSVNFVDLTVENGTNRLTIYGDTNITRDVLGLDKARRLLAILNDAVSVMSNDQAMRMLPARVETEPTAADAPLVKNPFMQ